MLPVDARPLGPDSLTWRYFGDARGMLMTVRAGVLQAMHPAINAALLQHSDFLENPINRLLRSAPPILGVVYDGPEAGATGAWVRDQHKTIKGTDNKGRKYHALSPDAFYWAHATFFESIIAGQELFGNRLGAAERELLYEESIDWYALYGLTMRPVPESYAAFQEYWEHMLHDVLEPTKVALGTFAPTGALPAPYPWLAGPAWTALRPLASRGPTSDRSRHAAAGRARHARPLVVDGRGDGLAHAADEPAGQLAAGAGGAALPAAGPDGDAPRGGARTRRSLSRLPKAHQTSPQTSGSAPDRGQIRGGYS